MMANIPVMPPLLLAQFNSETAWLFPGLRQLSTEFSKQANFPDEVLDDMDGEQETFATRVDSDAVDGEIEGEEFLVEGKDDFQVSDLVVDPVAMSESKISDLDSTGLRSVLKEASKGVSEGTHADYKR